MADKEQGAVKGLHRLLHPLPGGNVQVVGGLVQNQEAGLLVHEHTQAQAGKLAAGEGRHALKHILPLKLILSQAIAGALGGHALFLVEHGVKETTLRVGKADDLRQVRRDHRRAQADGAAVRPLRAYDHIQQRGFPGAVFPQEGNALPGLHPKINIREQGPLSKGFRKAPELQHLVAPELPAGELGVHLLCLGGLFRGAHTLDALFHGEGPLMQGIVAHKGPQVHLIGGLFQLPDLGLLLEILLHALLVAPLLFHGVEAVIPAVKRRLTVGNFDDAGNGAV